MYTYIKVLTYLLKTFHWNYYYYYILSIPFVEFVRALGEPEDACDDDEDDDTPEVADLPTQRAVAAN